jgi:hypothetical protein
MSEYLSQRRKDAKVLRKKLSSELGAFASWREEYPSPRCFLWRILYKNG